MKFTKETLKRTFRTFLQAAIAYVVASYTVIDFTAEKDVVKAALAGLLTSGVAAGMAAVMNLQSGEELGGGAMTFDDWVKKYVGKAIDADGISGVQCVDLIKHYCRNVIGMTKSYTDAWGNAVDWYNGFNNKPWLKENFTRIPYTKGMKIQKGDVGVFKTASKNGHIVVCTGVYDSKGFEAYDENYNGTHAGMTKRTFAYTGNRTLLGVLRPKDTSNIILKPKAPTVKPGTYRLTNVRGVYKGYGAASGRKKVNELTADGKKNATAKSGDAYLKAGTEVTIKETKLLNTGNLWAKIPSGFICIWEADINKKFIK